MRDPQPSSSRGHDAERQYQRDPDPAEAADRPLESRASNEPLHVTDDVPADHDPADPHHALNTPVGEPDPTADSGSLPRPQPGRRQRPCLRDARQRSGAEDR